MDSEPDANATAYSTCERRTDHEGLGGPGQQKGIAQPAQHQRADDPLVVGELQRSQRDRDQHKAGARGELGNGSTGGQTAPVGHQQRGHGGKAGDGQCNGSEHGSDEWLVLVDARLGAVREGAPGIGSDRSCVILPRHAKKSSAAEPTVL